jgi:hypothetical protein
MLPNSERGKGFGGIQDYAGRGATALLMFGNARALVAKWAARSFSLMFPSI